MSDEIYAKIRRTRAKMKEDEAIEKTFIPMYQKSGRIDPSAIQMILAQNDIRLSYDKAKQLRKQMELQGDKYERDEMINMTKDQPMYPPGWYPRPQLHEYIDHDVNNIWKDLGGKNKIDGIKHVRSTIREFLGDNEYADNWLKAMKDTKAEIYMMHYALNDPEPITKDFADENEDVGVVDILPLLPHLVRLRMKKNLDSR